MVISLEQAADLHMAQLMSLPLTVSCFSKIQIGFAFLVPADLGGPGKRAVKWVCVCVCAFVDRFGENIIGQIMWLSSAAVGIKHPTTPSLHYYTTLCEMLGTFYVLPPMFQFLGTTV